MRRPPRREGVSEERITDITWVRDTATLESVCARAGREGRFAIDTEFIRDRTYYPVLALIQLNIAGELFIVDPTARLDLDALDALMSDPSVQKILHACGADLEIFYLRTGQAPANIFDTQVAAGFAGLGHQIGLGGLTEAVIDVHIDKGPQFTDWLRRPLDPAQERYAAEDVRWLLTLHDELLADVDQRGRLDALAEELARLNHSDRYSPSFESVLRRVKGRGKLSPEEQAVLRRVIRWREDEAMRADRPRRWIMGDDTAVALAREAPHSLDDLGRVRGVQPGLVRRAGRSLLHAVDLGLSDPPVERPKRAPRPKVSGVTVSTSLLMGVLKSLCEDAQIATALVATSTDLEALVEAFALGTLQDAALPLLNGWRGELAGQRLLDFLEGRASVHLDPETQRPILTRR